MLTIIAVLAILSATYVLFRLTRRHDPELPQYNFNYDEPPPNARPLFAPTREELQLEAETNAARALARREYRAKAGARAAVDAALLKWRAMPDRNNAAELLGVAAGNGLEGDFSRAASEIIEQFHGPGIDGLANNDLAALLDSHIRLVSDQERASGAMFWLKQEAAKLRTETVVDQR